MSNKGRGGEGPPETAVGNCIDVVHLKTRNSVIVAPIPST